MIKTEKDYNAIVERVEELLQNPDNIENKDAKGYVELNVLSEKKLRLLKSLNCAWPKWD